MTKKRKEPPFLMLLVTRHPKAIALSAAGYGMLFRILGHFWETDLAPLPTTDHDLFVIARAHRPTWVKHRTAILAILSDVVPQLQAHCETHLRRSENLRQFFSSAGRAPREKRLERVRDQKLDTFVSIGATPKRVAANRAVEVQKRVATDNFVE